MICPHCNYRDGDLDPDDDWKMIEGDKGSFYVSQTLMARPDGLGRSSMSSYLSLYGCPNCSKTFMG